MRSLCRKRRRKGWRKRNKEKEKMEGQDISRRWIIIQFEIILPTINYFKKEFLQPQRWWQQLNSPFLSHIFARSYGRLSSAETPLLRRLATVYARQFSRLKIAMSGISRFADRSGGLRVKIHQGFSGLRGGHAPLQVRDERASKLYFMRPGPMNWEVKNTLTSFVLVN